MEKAWSVESLAVKPIKGRFSDAEDEPKVNGRDRESGVIIMEIARPVESFAVKPIEGQFSDAEDEPEVNVANLEIKDANAFKASRGSQRGGHGGRGGRDQSGAGRGCFKCGQEGHFSRECPNQSSGGGGMDGDIKCKKWVEQGHLSRKSKCLNCGRKGHFSRDCPNPICFKCGEEGHFAYKCPSKSQGSVYIRIPGKSSGEVVLDGDTKCSKCGEQDHLSRNCPRCAKCFRCQEKGHFKRDCPQVQAPLAGENANGLNSNELAEMDSAPILMNLVNGSGGRGGHGGPSDRGGHGGTPRGGRMSKFWAATSKYLETPQ